MMVMMQESISTRKRQFRYKNAGLKKPTRRKHESEMKEQVRMSNDPRCVSAQEALESAM